MERQFHGDLGPNTADLSHYTGTGGTYSKPRSSTTTRSGNIGDWPDDGTVDNDRSVAEPARPAGRTAQRENGNDDVTMQIITYIQFPAQAPTS